MSFSFTDEQEEFRGVLRRFLEDKSPTTEVRRLMETPEGCDRAVWSQMSQEMGLSAIHIPESYGGSGYGFVELGIVLEEMGRALLCAPYFASTVLGANAILNAGDEKQKRSLLPPLASGEGTATLAFTESNGRWDADGIEMTARPGDGDYRLSGEKNFVIDGHTADLLIVVARSPGSQGEDGLSFFAVPRSAPGISSRLLNSVDPTRKIAHLTFEDVSAEPLGEVGAGAEPLRRTLHQATIGLSNEMIGGAARLFESAIEYTRMRMQFGRVIGSFQSIKHKCADMLVEVELAKSSVYYAAAAVADGDSDVPALASLAKSSASDTYMQTAINAIQLHGGIGFTWDNDTHLWFKRAKGSEVFLGDATYHREQLMRHWEV
ncbi:MAG: acyl-CoA/acyl-ACP dehydrogenase [Gammaproteobacteria bacterium]|nr:acyl-CoA/acyl-ACP dehydrogenase [Gammaproteobacteria bacterium]